MAKSKGLNFRLLGKIGFLLVVIGFFMPVLKVLIFEGSGFKIAGSMLDSDKNALSGILMYLVFFSAVAGLAIGAMLLMKKSLNPTIDWAVIAVCIVSGLIVYFRHMDSRALKLQSGAYAILIGWIVALVFQLISKVNKET